MNTDERVRNALGWGSGVRGRGTYGPRLPGRGVANAFHCALADGQLDAGR